MRSLLFVVIIMIGAWAALRAWRSRFSFRDQVVLITGGSRGLGLVLARQICQEGGKVVLLARDWEELQRAERDLIAGGAEVLTVPCDLIDPWQLQAAIQQAQQRFGQIDVLINNAGIIDVGP